MIALLGDYGKYVTAAAASRIAQLTEEKGEIRRVLNDIIEGWQKRAETAEAALTQAQAERELSDKWKTNAYIAEMLNDFQKIRHADLSIGRALAERWLGPTYLAIALQVDIAEILKLRAQKSALMEALEPFAENIEKRSITDWCLITDWWEAAARVYEQVKKEGI